MRRCGTREIPPPRTVSGEFGRGNVVGDFPRDRKRGWEILIPRRARKLDLVDPELLVLLRLRLIRLLLNTFDVGVRGLADSRGRRVGL
jgi:hypothetical protein